MSTISRAALESMGVRDLRARAQNVGVSPQAIEEARDSAQPKQQLIDLILAAVDALNAMGMRELRAKAAEAGVSAQAIDEARDGAEPKVRRRVLHRLPLILSQASPRSYLTPWFCCSAT
jgi:SOS response regulatory protein OraA/RecX|eukprot:COSAG02_NODE_1421_length_12690_cov_13.851561_6_plen_119_part_00